MNKVWIILALAGILTGALQAKEFIVPGYVFVRDGSMGVFRIIDANADRPIPPMEGLGNGEN
jgi:hypothetical protein